MSAGGQCRTPSAGWEGAIYINVEKPVGRASVPAIKVGSAHAASGTGEAPVQAQAEACGYPKYLFDCYWIRWAVRTRHQAQARRLCYKLTGNIQGSRAGAVDPPQNHEK